MRRREGTSRETPEKKRLIELVGRGWTDERIARGLEVSRRTVQRRLRRLAEELDGPSRPSLVVRAIQVGLVSCREVLRWEVTRTGHSTTQE